MAFCDLASEGTHITPTLSAGYQQAESLPRAKAQALEEHVEGEMWLWPPSEHLICHGCKSAFSRSRQLAVCKYVTEAFGPVKCPTEFLRKRGWEEAWHVPGSPRKT